MDVILTEEEIKEYTDEIIAYNVMSRFEEELTIHETVRVNDTVHECVEYLSGEATKHEPNITEDLKAIIPEDCYFEGLDNRIKSDKRIKNKLIEDAKRKYGNDYIKAANHLYDSLRYTIIMPFDNHFDYLDEFLNRLLDLNYTLYRVKNRWKDEFCKGVQIVAKDPSGYPFEIQVHTKENYDVKEIYSREPYNLSRNEKAPSILKDKANMLRSYYHRSVHLPDGAEYYKFERRKITK